MKTHANSLGAVVVAVLAALSLAACDREAPPKPRTAEREGATLGQKIDHALDTTQQKIAEAGQKTKQELAEAGDRISGATDKAIANTREAVAGKPDERPARSVMGDTGITASIKTDYLKDPDLSVLKIDVDTRDGVVVLNGLADNDAARTRAERIAQSVKGVREVRNYLTIKRT